MTDLDQGGVDRQWIKTWFGPTLGWAMTQIASIFAVSAGGTTNVPKLTTLVMVNFNGAVTLQLASTIPSGVSPLPLDAGTLFVYPLTIVDVGGFAAANPITILPAVGELIMGLASIQIANDHGSFSLLPKRTGGWEQQ